MNLSLTNQVIKTTFLELGHERTLDSNLISVKKHTRPLIELTESVASCVVQAQRGEKTNETLQSEGTKTKYA